MIGEGARTLSVSAGFPVLANDGCCRLPSNRSALRFRTGLEVMAYEDSCRTRQHWNLRPASYESGALSD